MGHPAWSLSAVSTLAHASEAAQRLKPDLIFCSGSRAQIEAYQSAVGEMTTEVPWILVPHEPWTGPLDGAIESLDPEQITEAEVTRLARWALAVREPRERARALLVRDETTGAHRRRALLEAGTKRLIGSNPQALLLVDVDRFRSVNAIFGYEAADKLLQDVLDRILAAVPSSALVARISADEFAVLIPGGGSQAAKHLQDVLRDPFRVAGGQVCLTASIGLAQYPEHASGMDALLTVAVNAASRAKQEGGNVIVEADHEDGSNTARWYELDLGLRDALDRNEFRLDFQPQLELATGRVVGFEALLRWERRGSIVAPSEFIPALESTGLIIDVGEWVLKQACLQTRAWADEGLVNTRVSVNVSATQLRRSNFARIVEDALSEARLPAQALELEITESLLLDLGADLTHTQLARLRRRGIRIALDDFGTGYASLAYLRNLSVDLVKIDRAFVADLEADSRARAVMAALVALGNGLDLELLAEGIEEESQKEILMKGGTKLGQGFLFARPMPAQEVMGWWRRHSKTHSVMPSSLPGAAAG